MLEERIIEYELQDRLILLGNKKNPFPYMRQCDIYVQPSYYEGYGLTVAEAKVLCKPIVASDIPAFREQLIDGKNAIISELDEFSLYKAIKYLLDNKKEGKRFRENLKSFQFDNSLELSKLYDFIQA